jgi:hypothetical protein
MYTRNRQSSLCVYSVAPSYLEKESSDEEALTLAVSDLAVVNAVRFADPKNSRSVVDPGRFGIFRLMGSVRIPFLNDCSQKQTTLSFTE